MSVVVLHDLLYVLGRRNEFNDDDSSVEIYNPYTDTWEYRITSSSGFVNINGGEVVNKCPLFIKKSSIYQQLPNFSVCFGQLYGTEFFL